MKFLKKLHGFTLWRFIGLPFFKCHWEHVAPQLWRCEPWYTLLLIFLYKVWSSGAYHFLSLILALNCSFLTYAHSSPLRKRRIERCKFVIFRYADKLKLNHPRWSRCINRPDGHEISWKLNKDFSLFYVCRIGRKQKSCIINRTPICYLLIPTC